MRRFDANAIAVSIPERVLEALKLSINFDTGRVFSVSIPERVLEALKRYILRDDFVPLTVSIPERVLEALKLKDYVMKTA